MRYELVERDGITTLTVRHRGFTTDEARTNHANGWVAVLQLLQAFVASRT